MTKVHRWTPHYINSGSAKLISSGRGIVGGILLSGAGNCSLSLFDSATATNLTYSVHRKITVLAFARRPANWDVPLDFLNGLAVSIAGTGANAVVAFKRVT